MGRCELVCQTTAALLADGHAFTIQCWLNMNILIDDFFPFADYVITQKRFRIQYISDVHCYGAISKPIIYDYCYYISGDIRFWSHAGLFTRKNETMGSVVNTGSITSHPCKKHQGNKSPDFRENYAKTADFLTAIAVYQQMFGLSDRCSIRLVNLTR